MAGRKGRVEATGRKGRVEARVVLLGATHAGKTGLVQRYLRNIFLGESVPFETVSLFFFS
jgi:GTPase SAR1 family protein